MQLLPATILAFSVFLGAARAIQQPDDRQEVVAALRGYSSALKAGIPDKVGIHLGPSFFMADERSTPASPRVSAHLFLTAERLSAWPKNYLDQVGPHQSNFDTVSVSLRGDAAVVVTRETGSNAFRSWTNEETTWFLGRINGAWRIVGMVIRDFQPPK